MFEGERKGRERKRKKDSGIFTQSRNRYIYIVEDGRRRELKEKGKKKKRALIIIRFSFTCDQLNYRAVILEINLRWWRRVGCCDEGWGGDIVDLRVKRKIDKLKLNS